MKKLLRLTMVFVLFAQITNAQVDYALQLDATNSQRLKYTTTADDILDTKLNGATDYTIELWVKPTSATFHNTVLLKRWNQFALTLYKDADFRFYLTVYGASTVYVNTINNAFTLNEWNHIVIICNSADNTIKLYNNGVDVTDDTETAADVVLADSPASSNLYLSYGGSGTYFTGLMDKIRVKNTAETIGDLQTSVTDDPYTTDDNTAILYNFNEGTGLSTVNEADNKDATLQCSAGDCTNGEVWWIDLSTTTALAKNSATSFSIYPNPTDNTFVIQAEDNEEIKKVELFNISGKSVQTVNFDNDVRTTNIDVSDLQTGVYFVKTTTDKGIGTKKIIIN